MSFQFTRTMNYIASQGGVFFSLLFALLFAAAIGAQEASSIPRNQVEIDSLQELAECAAQNNQRVVMKAGNYDLRDFLPESAIAAMRARKEFQYITFSGSHNYFDLTGVTIEAETALRQALRPPIHNNDFAVTGDYNSIKGLTITNTGDGTSPGGALISIQGKGNTLRNCTFTVTGSYPYGYGDLFGKGGGSVIGHRKQSGVHVTGDGTRLIGCKLFMRAFGHGYYVQEDASDVYFEDCNVEGKMRASNEILAETSGPAFDVGFRTVMRMRGGENRVHPGYMKSLSEDGFRTYGQHENLVFKNCTAKNMRGAFELRSKTAVRLENCTSIGNERGFWVSDGARLTGCNGDAQYGPLLFVEGDGASVEMTLLPAETDAVIHALATIHGTGHEVTIASSEGKARTRPLPILLGYAQPGAGEGMAPIGERAARNVTLKNGTRMPIRISAEARSCTISTLGAVAEDNGIKNEIRSARN